MAVSSLKGCWSKLSARIRDYIDVVDSYYRPNDEVDGLASTGEHLSASHRAHKCGRKDCPLNTYIHSSSPSSKEKRSISGKSSHQHRHHHRHHHHHHHHDHDQNCSLPHDRVSSRTTTTTANNQQVGSVPDFSRKQNGLPSGYTKRKTAQGQVYFVDLAGHKYWHDPSVPKELLNATLDLDSLVGQLSTNWEIKQTGSGRTYFINHTKKTTQFTDPRLITYKDQLMAYLRRSMTLDRLSRIQLYADQGDTNGPTNNERSTDSGSGHPILTSVNRTDRRVSSRRPEVDDTSMRSPNQHQVSVAGQQTQRGQRSSNVSGARARDSDNFELSNRHGSTMNLTTRPNDILLNATIDGRIGRATNFHKNLLRGSHNNLSSSTGAGHSNTFTGPMPAWFKPHMLLASARKQQKTSVITSTSRQAPVVVVTTTTTSSTGQQPITLNSSQNNDNKNTDTVGIQQQNICQATYLTDQLSPPFDAYQSAHLRPDSARSKELSDKISLLRQELLKQQVLTHPCKIAVNRERIFEESYRAICQMLPRDLKKRLIVKFRGEAGLDYGGVAREWFYLLSREILNPVHGLFQYTSDDIYNLQINPDSGIVYREHLSYLNFCGRVIGMAVFHGHFIEGHFTLPFYKMLLGKPINLSDIEYVDPELYSSLCWILENDKTDMIDTTFLVQHNAFGQLQEHELKEGGRNIAVTEANKHEYVSLYVNYRCRRGIESQFEALQRGFYELISPSLLENFDEHELELLIGGLSKIDVDDWRLHTKLKNCTTETPLIVWFWDIVKSYGEDRRARLLQFVTGSPRVPIQGFKALQGFNSEPRLFTIHLIRNANTDDLPKSHTCFNRIDVPPYETYDKLRDKLTQAIEETMGFAMQ